MKLIKRNEHSLENLSWLLCGLGKLRPEDKLECERKSFRAFYLARCVAKPEHRASYLRTLRDNYFRPERKTSETAYDRFAKSL